MFESPTLSKRQVQSRLTSQYLTVSGIELPLFLLHPLSTSKLAIKCLLQINLAGFPNPAKRRCKHANASKPRKRQARKHIQPTCYQTSHTSRIEKDSHRFLLIPGRGQDTLPAQPQLSCLYPTRRQPPPPILAQHHRHRHLTRRSPNIQVSTARLAWAWGHMRASWRGTCWRPRMLGNSIPRGHVPGSFVGWESLALLHARLIARCALD
jgi:hypothetical protein